MRKNWIKNLYYRINPRHKDRLFCTIFGRERYKKYALELYNAVNGSNYSDLGMLEIVTLEDAIYIKMKNDVAYLISDNMALYEHQSTVNPNMPLRGFTYFGELYSKYITFTVANIYGKNLVKLPTPQYIVFYNGTEDYPEVSELKLSDAFMSPNRIGTYEFTATVYNINLGKNEKLLDACEPLYGYSLLVEKYRSYSGFMTPKLAMDRAVTECINEGHLTDVLTEQRSSVMLEILTTYNKKAYEEDIREEGREEMRTLKDAEIERIKAEKDAEIERLKSENSRLKQALPK